VTVRLKLKSSLAVTISGNGNLIANENAQADGKTSVA